MLHAHAAVKGRSQRDAAAAPRADRANNSFREKYNDGLRRVYAVVLSDVMC